MKTVKCQMCGKIVEKKGARKYCLQCRKIRDDEIAKNYSERHSQMRKEMKEKM